MSSTQRTETVSFTTKGQVVIPRWLRKDFEINEGTRAVVYKHNDHIVLKPLTAQHYRRMRGSLKGTKAMEVFMSERKREGEL
jgi:AbrB family looped-hinge helix DNA binding protein